jgi:hypothetical protein
MTDPNSLIFSAMLLCRLTAPLCLNFLGMIHLDNHITTDFGVETQFTKVCSRADEFPVYRNFQLMGHLDVVPLVARGINIYLPIFIVFLCLSTYYRIGTRFLHSIGVDQFVDDDEMTSEMIQSGRAIVQLGKFFRYFLMATLVLERSKISRQRDREQRRETWANKLSNVVKGQSSGKDGDRLPIMEHLDEPLLVDDDTRQKQHNDFDDLELGNSAFLIDTTPTSLLRSERQSSREGPHPTSASIFDDL